MSRKPFSFLEILKQINFITVIYKHSDILMDAGIIVTR